MAKDWRTLKLEVLAETTQFVKGMDKANKETESFGDKIGDFAKKAGIALAAVGAAAGAMAIKIGKEAVAAASDLAETVSKVNVIFGQSAKNIEQFAATAAASLGQTRTQAMNAAATFGIFGKSAGLVGQELTSFSTQFVTLASDLASFNNTSVDQAINALGAALRGESEPIRAYGVLLNDATLKAKAMEMGIYSGTGTLTAQQKVLAAHKVILEQTKDAQGDFARTADGMANSQRILTARLDEAKIVLGTALLPIVLEVLNVFNNKFLPVIEKIAASFGGSEGLVQQTKNFVSQARDGLAPILNALSNAFEMVNKAVKDNKDNIQAVLNLFRTMADFFVAYVVPIIKYQLLQAIEGIGIAFSTVIKIVGPVIGVVSNVVNGLLTLIDSAIQRINSLITAYNRISILPDIPTIPQRSATPIAPSIQLPFGGGTVGGGAASSTLSGGLPTVGSVLGSAFATGGTSLGGRMGLGGAKPEPQIQNIDNWINQQIAKGEAITAAQQATNAELVRVMTARAAAGLITAAPITVNVNAPSVIDEEGFSRAVIEALNNSTNRGTGGGGSLRTEAQII